jgi:hypothetical protein
VVDWWPEIFGLGLGVAMGHSYFNGGPRGPAVGQCVAEVELSVQPDHTGNERYCFSTNACVDSGVGW